jgi:hypothetical protein
MHQWLRRLQPIEDQHQRQAPHVNVFQSRPVRPAVPIDRFPQAQAFTHRQHHRQRTDAAD